MVDRRGVATATALGAGTALAGAVASVAVAVAAILAAGDAALSPGFYWGSAAAVVALHSALGLLAGRLVAPRLRRAGVVPGRSLYALAAAGPVAVALLTGLRPLDGVPHPLSTLLPAFASAVGAVAACVPQKARRPASGDTGAGAIEYITVVLLIAMTGALISTSGLGGHTTRGIKAAVCEVVRAGGLAGCLDEGLPPATVPAPPAALPVDPNEPLGACMVGYDSHFLQSSATGQFKRLDVITDGGNFLALRHYVQGNGMPSIWEVVDNTWADVAVGTPSAGQDQWSAGIWGGPVGTSGNVYRFDDEKEAKEFYRKLKEHRTGNPLKTAVRTNPATSWASWLASRIPVVGKDYDEWIGGSEPDRQPSSEFQEGGLMFGFYNDLPILGNIAKITGKGWDWSFVGHQRNNETGETTIWLRTSSRAMESAQINLGPAWRYARSGTKGWASGGAEKAIQAIEKELTRRTGSPVTLPDATKKTIRLSPYVGIGGMLQWGTQYAITFDRDGRARSLVQTDNLALTGHVRGAVNLGPVGAWTNQSVIGTRWITNKSLDLTDPKDLAAAKRLWVEGSLNPIAARSALNDYFDQGGGTMAKVTYDSHEPVHHVSVGLPLVVLDFESDSENADASKAEYHVPGKGWVKWDKCGAR